jgi:hypothetical protein
VPDAVEVSEEVLEKAQRLLVEGRLTVERRGEVDGHDAVNATCEGDHGVYRLRRRRGVSSCSCPAPTLCAHLVALGLVVDPAPVPQ